MKTNQDITLCILPKIQPDAPTVGPAVLKSHCIDAGFTAQLVDFNIRLFHDLGETNSHYWYESDDVFYKKSKWPDFYNLFLKERVIQYAHELVNLNSNFIGLSIFSNRSLLFAYEFINEIKKIKIDQKIVIGGAGVYNIESFKKLNADFWIKGDAEISLVELLKGNTEYIGINSNKNQQLDNLDAVLYPNYDDIEWNKYKVDNAGGYQIAYITGSRGCVRDCTFCDVAAMWPKYRFRSGKHIAGEIIEVRKKHNIKAFEFTDSLVNGSMKAFREMCEVLANYRKLTGDADWNWQSQFIARSKTQMPPNDFKLMKESGGTVVAIGIESASESVRQHMKKGFSNKDMWYTFEQCKKNNIKIGIMMMVGYPTETKDDFNETLRMLEKLKSDGFFEINPETGVRYMHRISFGPTMQIYDGTPIQRMADHMGIYYEGNGENWIYQNNNIRVRIVRLLQAYAKIAQLGFTETWWMANRRNKNLIDEYKKITGKDLPENILDYDEELEY